VSLAAGLSIVLPSVLLSGKLSTIHAAVAGATLLRCTKFPQEESNVRIRQKVVRHILKQLHVTF
jgi:hypothetical protein